MRRDGRSGTLRAEGVEFLGCESLGEAGGCGNALGMDGEMHGWWPQTGSE